MEIKSTINIGTIKTGDIVDATVSPDGVGAYAYDSDSVIWYFDKSGYEIVTEDTVRITDAPVPDHCQPSAPLVLTPKDYFGQELSSITFK